MAPGNVYRFSLYYIYINIKNTCNSYIATISQYFVFLLLLQFPVIKLKNSFATLSNRQIHFDSAYWT